MGCLFGVVEKAYIILMILVSVVNWDNTSIHKSLLLENYKSKN